MQKMQKMSVKFFAATILMGLLALPVTMSASQDRDRDDQPHMRAALEALKQAEMHLNEAAHDKGGHRVAALKATREAIKHVQEGIKVGDKHEDRHEHGKMDKK